MYKLLILILSLISILSADTLSTLEQLRNYDLKRIRITTNPDHKKREYPVTVQGATFYSREAEPVLISVVPEASDALKRAARRRITGKILLFTGTALGITALVAAPFEAPAILYGIGWGGYLPFTLSAGIVWGKSNQYELQAYQMYENQLRKDYDISYLRQYDNPKTPEQNYMTYLSKSLRFSLDYIPNSFYSSPWLLDGTGIKMHAGSGTQASEAAKRNSLKLAPKLLNHAANLERAAVITRYTGMGLMSGGMGALMIGGLTLLLNGGDGETLLIVCGAAAGSGAALTIASIPMSYRAQRIYFKGLVTYDQELRGKYGIQISWQ